MNKICTSIEQSKKLIELGIDMDTADMYNVPYFGSNECRYCISQPMTGPNYSPAWSLAALIDILPLEIETHKQIDENKIYYYVESYMKHMEKEIYLSTKRHENLIDACYEMAVSYMNLKCCNFTTCNFLDKDEY